MSPPKDAATLQSSDHSQSDVQARLDDRPVSTGATGVISAEELPTAPTVAVEARSSAPSSSVPASAETLDTTDRYRVRSVLGRGGMGEVVLCEDTLMGRAVALKRMREETRQLSGAQQRFLREARVQARIEHPSVVPVYDLVAASGPGSFFTMRRIRGRTLEEIVAGLAGGDVELARRFSRRKLLTAFVSVCLAVHYAHTRGVVHRDLKPGNIMFGDFGEVYVLDWGIAKVLEETSAEQLQETTLVPAPIPQAWTDSSSEKLTEAGQLVGTLGYMAPEQRRGREVEARADVYSLGAILYEMLALKPLHEPSSVRQHYESVQTGKIASVESNDLPPELDRAWRCACALRPEDRFQSAQELAEAVERFLDGDRDLEQRRKLATDHATRAEAALQRAFSPGLPAGEATAARLEATSEVMKVLALEPNDKQARHMLARLLVEAPEELPAEAEAALQRAAVEARMHAIRAGLMGFLSWLACVPLALLLGVRHWLPLILMSTTLLLGAAFNVWIIRTRNTRTWAVILLASLAIAVVVLASSWLGPFVMVPTAAAITTLLFATQATPRERYLFMGIGVLGASLPFVGDFLGLVPPGFAFQDKGIVLLERAFALPPTATLLALLYASVSFCIVPTIYVGRLRDSLSRAERKVFLNAWQLSRLASD